MSALTEITALQLAARIRARDVSIREVVDLHLDQLHRCNPEIHAIVHFADSARADAEQAERRLLRGESVGVFHGVPFTVKDWIEAKGVACDGGFSGRAGFVPQADATVVQRMRQAGAILLGKSRAGSDPTLHPLPLNPLDTRRTPGSSSGGEAAAIAAHGSPLGLGSDSGGSLRWPAHCCGVVTLKPSAGLVPLTGHYPPIIALTDPRTVIGPLARSVADVAAVLAVIAGPDGADASVVPVPVTSHADVDVKRLRLAWFSGFPGAQANESVGAALQAAVRALAPRVASVGEAAPPRIEEAMDITRAYWARPESMHPDRWQPWGASTLSADEVEASLFRWDRLRRSFAAFMQDVDVILCPAAAEAAPARHEPGADDYAFTVPFSLTGSPVVVLKAGTDPAGLPLGIQVVAAPFRDHVALAVAAALQFALQRL